MVAPTEALHSGQSEPQRDILSLKQGPLLQPAEDWKPTCLTLYPWALASWLLSVARIFSHSGLSFFTPVLQSFLFPIQSSP